MCFNLFVCVLKPSIVQIGCLVYTGCGVLKMFALERLRIIRNYINEHKQVEVHALSGMLNVSEVTIRRDLERLEGEGFLTRTHGGAVLNVPDDPPVIDAGTAESTAHEREIAAVAVRMVRDNDVIMLSNGGTNLQIARRLTSRSNVTVLTNDLLIALELSKQPRNKAVLLGGDLDADQRALFGPVALENTRKYFVNRLFAEVDGVSRQLHLSVVSQEKAALLREARTIAEETVVVCVAERFDRSAFFRLGGVEFANKFISNPALVDSFKNELFGSNVQLFTSIDAFEGSV